MSAEEDQTKASSRAALAAAVEARKNPVEDDTEMDCCPEGESDESFSFCVGNYDVRYSAITGKLTHKERENPLEDGWYTDVRVENGCIVEAKKESKNVTVLNADCCPEGDETAQELKVMDNECNLTEDTADGLLTKFQWEDCDDFAAMKGCGSLKMPFGFKIDWDAVKADFFDCGITASRCGVEVKDGLVTKLPPSIITGVVNESQGVLKTWIDDDCKIHIELLGSGSGKQPVYEEEIKCQADSQLASGNVGDECNDGAGNLAVDETSGFTAQVFESSEGIFSIDTASEGSARFCNPIPNQFSSLADAQQWITLNKGIICGCSSRCAE